MLGVRRVFVGTVPEPTQGTQLPAVAEMERAHPPYRRARVRHVQLYIAPCARLLPLGALVGGTASRRQ